jgi:hypothetical protein
MDESFTFFEMAADLSSYRLPVIPYWKFFKKQPLGICRRIYCYRLFDNHHRDCVDDHKIYFFKTARGRYGLTMPAL